MIKSWTNLIIISCMISTTWAAEPVVSNVRASQRTDSKLVDIYYDVLDTDGDAMTVSIMIEDGATQILATSLTGDIGPNILSGTDKHVLWNAGADWNGLFSDAIKFGVAATDDHVEPPPSGMVRIPAGTNSGDDPVYGGYSITLANDIFMHRTEVTREQWSIVRGWAVENGYTISAGAGKDANHPVHSVSWYDCVKWCNAKSEMERLTPCYDLGSWGCNFSANGYRLPTKLEWEYAARGGLRGKLYPWGDTISYSEANYSGHPDYRTGAEPYTGPAGSFSPNGYGLYDIAGNQWELCWDMLDSVNRVTRGGSWDNADYMCRCGRAVTGVPPGGSYNSVGFRPVRNTSD